ncbi:MAG: DoxX family protein [Candidatus Eiseniibacteriota bacterium]
MATSLGLLVLRLGAGGLLLTGHGWGKLTHAATRAETFADPLGLGAVPSFWLVVFAEVVCAALVMLGLFTRLSALVIVVFLCVAGFIHHAQDPWPRRELAFIYAAAFVTLLLTGGGRFSLDEFLGIGWLRGRGRG